MKLRAWIPEPVTLILYLYDALYRMAPAADMRRSLVSSGKFIALVVAEVSVVLNTTLVKIAVT